MRERDIHDSALAPRGRDRIEWAERAMPVLAAIRRRFAATRPLAGVRVAACMHVTAETAALVRTLAAGGASVRLCASNPLSTQDDVAAALVVDDGIAVFARAGEDRATYFAHLEAALAHRPQLVMDDGAESTTTAIGSSARHQGEGDGASCDLSGCGKGTLYVHVDTTSNRATTGRRSGF